MTLVVKLGSSIVADDEGDLRAEVLDGICGSVEDLASGGERVVMVTSGAIARGVRLLDLPARPDAIDQLQAASAMGQGSLYRAYEERLATGGIRSAQVLLTAFDMSHRINYLNARQTLRRLLAWSVVPVINENDTTATDEITFGDNDFLSAQVAIMLEADRLVLLTNTDGLFTADPGRDPAAELIEEVSGFDQLEGYEIGMHTSTHGSGGMRSKVVAAEMASAAGVPVTICNGIETGSLVAAASGEAVGTRFLPHTSRAPSFKLWLRYAAPARGRIEVDAGAARMLREGGASLLPVGIIGVEGEFTAGDPVEVVSEGQAVGKGMVAHGAATIERLKGRRSTDVREIVGEGAEEAVHRDRFVLT